MKPKAAISWSGGKDSCAALMRAADDFDVVAMITMLDEHGDRSRSHGLRRQVIAAHARRVDLESIVGCCTWATYDDAFRAALDRLPPAVTHVVFGDILFDEHRDWAERICAHRDLVAVEPLFGESTEALFGQWLDGGGHATIVTTRAERLDASWLGRPLAADMLPWFKRLGIDPCGERGEYHTVVTDCALFSAPLPLGAGPIVERHGCWALDVTVAEPGSMT
jgi:uncharacterized protein (TIGR00290 family)